MKSVDYSTYVLIFPVHGMHGKRVGDVVLDVVVYLSSDG